MLVLSCAPHLPCLTWDSARKKSPGTLGKMPTGAPTLGDPARRAFGEGRNRAITLRLLPPILFRPFRGPFLFGGAIPNWRNEYRKCDNCRLGQDRRRSRPFGRAISRVAI